MLRIAIALALFSLALSADTVTENCFPYGGAQSHPTAQYPVLGEQYSFIDDLCMEPSNAGDLWFGHERGWLTPTLDGSFDNVLEDTVNIPISGSEDYQHYVVTDCTGSGCTLTSDGD